MFTLPILVAALVAVAVLIFVPFLRRIFFVLLRLVIFAAGLAGAVAGIAIMMNNETPFEKPGARQRVIRFVTMNSAAASKDGHGSVVCEMGPNGVLHAAAAPSPVPMSPEEAKMRQLIAAAKQSPTATPTPTPTVGVTPEDDVFPELIRRGFPGLSRQKLFQLSQETVNSLGGWKIIKADPHNYTLDCIYRTRIFGWEDDVRITILPSGDIDVCSRSGTARPDSTSMLRWFPGDLAANIGHIKEFYEVLEPKMDAVYKEEQDKENAKKPR
ncbi:MAG: hypothetical protein Q7S58_11620 [Candidatus Binatus sp.]|uniref:hypothetical protein n=1 Tax=Candidatus Binatus sp. TaxID=2811406 RepID=UPI00271710C0|nr:hypothetical protein [Candidatus Binatus sp.]MDO8433046.1 hypothetical protein [Candidatus Binatus sp.]